MLKRRLRSAGDTTTSLEVTIPNQLLWHLDPKKEYDVVFDVENGKIVLEFEEVGGGSGRKQKRVQIPGIKTREEEWV